MPTLCAARRRGIPPEAIVAFCEQQGVSKANALTEVEQLEHVIRAHLNGSSPRLMGVLDPLKVIIDSFPADQTEWLDARSFPEDHPDDASRRVPFTRELFIEREDFMEDPPAKFYRLAPGREVRLRWGYFLRCTHVDHDADGNVIAVHCTHDPATRGGEAPDGRRVKATLHWVSASHGVPVEVRLYDRLFSVERPGADRDFREDLSPDSLQVVTGIVEPAAAALDIGARVQLERVGYFAVDPDSTPGQPIFNRTLTLKDAWKRLQQRQEAPAPAPAPAPAAEPKKKQSKKALDLDAARAEKGAALAARFDRLMAAHGLSPDDAHLLTSSEARADFFEAALAAGGAARTAANLINNDLLAAIKDRPGGVEGLPFGGAALGALARLLDEEVISSRIAKEVLEKMLAGQGDPAAIVAREGLQQVSDPAALGALVERVLAENAEVVAQVRAGDARRRGFLVGQLMKASGGQANPRLLQQLLAEKLEG